MAAGQRVRHGLGICDPFCSGFWGWCLCGLSGLSVKQGELSFFTWCLFFLCFVVCGMQGKILFFSDVTVTLDRRVLLVFVHTTDIHLSVMSPVD